MASEVSRGRSAICPGCDPVQREGYVAATLCIPFFIWRTQVRIYEDGGTKRNSRFGLEKERTVKEFDQINLIDREGRENSRTRYKHQMND